MDINVKAVVAHLTARIAADAETIAILTARIIDLETPADSEVK